MVEITLNSSGLFVCLLVYDWSEMQKDQLVLQTGGQMQIIYADSLTADLNDVNTVHAY